ncbi:Lamp incomplete domain containing protein [Pandoravirus neocaledonia]|uniref:Lamp incomplete domain containing protein n=1 Tax=Pandoravirus neocaledonia TaxID=2107708 RepID=A0A2U7UC31_9VIRU|nr:Lamp incomplete domain containing protein [Pandoravirus neocaledonia]AVK75996.1 Lamp incomplete domain containing protein [Pandoravirus neocaledonia]
MAFGNASGAKGLRRRIGRPGWIIIIAVGGAVGLVVIVAAFIYIRRRSRSADYTRIVSPVSCVHFATCIFSILFK